MPLAYSGRGVKILFGVSFLARDQHGNSVSVQASVESVRDHGERAVKAKGSDKYDAGQFAGRPRRKVFVTTDEFRNREADAEGAQGDAPGNFKLMGWMAP
jgi:hypothetical protein